MERTFRKLKLDPKYQVKFMAYYERADSLFLFKTFLPKFKVSGNVNLIFNSQRIPSRDLVPRKILGDILRQVR